MFFSEKKAKSPINHNGKNNNIDKKTNKNFSSKKPKNPHLLGESPYYKEIMNHNKSLGNSQALQKIKIKNYET